MCAKSWCVPCGNSRLSGMKTSVSQVVDHSPADIRDTLVPISQLLRDVGDFERAAQVLREWCGVASAAAARRAQKFVAAVLDRSARRFRRGALTFIRQPGGQPLGRERLQVGAGVKQRVRSRRIACHSQPRWRAIMVDQ